MFLNIQGGVFHVSEHDANHIISLSLSRSSIYCCILICRDEDLPLIVAIDLQPMAPIEGVIQVQGDITNVRTAEVVHTAVLSQYLSHISLFH